MATNNNNNNNIGERFMNMVATFDFLIPIYQRTVPRNQSQKNYPQVVANEAYLFTHLRAWVNGYVVGSKFLRSGGTHRVMNFVGKDGRRPLPSTIRSAIDNLPSNQILWSQEKVEVKWVSCYLARVLVNNQIDGWQQFECSHRCIEFGLDGELCIDSGCMIWESKSVNQSRGYGVCMRKCNHCPMFLCSCQGIHNPHCL